MEDKKKGLRRREVELSLHIRWHSMTNDGRAQMMVQHDEQGKWAVSSISGLLYLLSQTSVSLNGQIDLF